MAGKWMLKKLEFRSKCSGAFHLAVSLRVTFRNPNRTTRWAAASYQWSDNPYKWPYKWVTGAWCFLDSPSIFLNLSLYFVPVGGWLDINSIKRTGQMLLSLWIMIHHNSVRSRVLTMIFSGSVSWWRTIWAASNIDTILVYLYTSIDSINTYVSKCKYIKTTTNECVHTSASFDIDMIFHMLFHMLFQYVQHPNDTLQFNKTIIWSNYNISPT